MNAVFIHRDSVLRDSHIPPDSPPESWHLAPATLEAMRSLATDDRLVIVYGPEHSAPVRDGEAPRDSELSRLSSQVESGGGRVDVLITCTEHSIQAGRCFGDFPGLIWMPAARLNLLPQACYLLGDSVQDVQTARSAGVRPFLILGERTIEDVLGRSDMDKGFPVAVDLTTAVSYIYVEEEIAQQVGSAAEPAPPVPSTLTLVPMAQELPTLTLVSRMAQAIEDNLGRSRIRRTDIARWLFFLTLGALGLSLGIGYLMTHLYRIQPFPEFAYYLTLQFISRPLRGALFILLGAGLIAIALRSFFRGTQLGSWLDGIRR
jgi:histidinol phosphatase-like enzyme